MVQGNWGSWGHSVALNYLLRLTGSSRSHCQRWALSEGCCITNTAGFRLTDRSSATSFTMSLECRARLETQGTCQDCFRFEQSFRLSSFFQQPGLDILQGSTMHLLCFKLSCRKSLQAGSRSVQQVLAKSCSYGRSWKQSWLCKVLPVSRAHRR